MSHPYKWNAKQQYDIIVLLTKQHHYTIIVTEHYDIIVLIKKHLIIQQVQYGRVQNHVRFTIWRKRITWNLYGSTCTLLERNCCIKKVTLHFTWQYSEYYWRNCVIYYVCLHYQLKIVNLLLASEITNHSCYLWYLLMLTNINQIQINNKHILFLSYDTYVLPRKYC